MFRFRLAVVQRLREADRDERRRELAEAFDAERIVLDQRAEVARDLDEAMTALRSASQAGAIDVERLTDGRRYAAQLGARIAAADHALVQIRQEIEKRREALTEADRQVRVLEKLEESQRQEWNKAESKREAKIIDAAALASHWRARDKEAAR